MTKDSLLLFGFESAKNKLPTAKRAASRDFWLTLFAVVLTFSVCVYFEFAERFALFLKPYEWLQLDETPFALFVLAVMAAWFSYRRMREVVTENNLRRKAEEELEKLLKENQSLARYAMQVQEDERRHLAREIHDDMAQYLTAIRMDALTVQKNASNEVDSYASRRIAYNTEHIQKAVRSLIQRLRPAALDLLGLIGALEQLASDWEARHPETKCELLFEESCQNLSERINIVTYRIVQEAMTNIERYAKAKTVNIHLGITTVATQATLCLEVLDDGIGYDESVSSKGVGIIGMRERVKSVNGTFNLFTGINSGVLIVVKIPISA